MENCIFCKIIKGEIPSYKIYEDDYVYAFLDIAKDYYGHTLVVPKTHCDNIFTCKQSQLQNIMSAIQTICNHYSSLGFNGANIITNAGKSSGQEVMHFHFHIIPRKDNDNTKVYIDQEKLDIDLDEVCKTLKIN